MNIKILSIVFIGLLSAGCSSDKGGTMKILIESCEDGANMTVTTGIGVFGSYAEATCEWKVKKVSEHNR